MAICVTSLPSALPSPFRRGGSWLLRVRWVVEAAACAGQAQLLVDLAEVDRGRVVGAGVRRQNLRQRGELYLRGMRPGHEGGHRHDLAEVVHRAMPDTAQLGASHHELAGRLRDGKG